jgi:NAD(P)-dependent dehydrogenase (short-subunit alcohol dehydrogenase family)
MRRLYQSGAGAAIATACEIDFASKVSSTAIFGEAAIQDKVVVITGATSGIGRIAAEKLAGQGARIVMIARDRGRAEETLARLREVGPGADHRVHYADLSLIADVKKVGAEIAAVEPRVDALLNNAGSMFGRRLITPEGHERTFVLNHMSYFVLTHCLRENVVAAAPARIVNTASAAHLRATLDFADLQTRNRYVPTLAYGRSKLANILFTRELGRRLAGTGVTANCLHPGFVATNFGQRDAGLFGWGLRLAMLFAARPPEPGADTIVHLAGSPAVEGVSGRYFYNSREITPSAAAQDDAVAARLWRESEKIAGFG